MHGRLQNQNRNYFFCLFAFVVSVLVFSGCSVEKKYHSWGWNIESKINARGSQQVASATSKKNNSHKPVLKSNPLGVKNPAEAMGTHHHALQHYGTSTKRTSNGLNTSNQTLFSVLIPAPTDTVFFPEKYQHRKHGTLYLPQIKNEDDFNAAAAIANSKDVIAWNWFDRGHISSKTALYWIFGLMAIIIVLGLGNISLAGIASSTRKTVTTILLLVPALLFAIGYICYLMGTFSIWSANKLYKKALYKLPYDLKLRGDAVIMHARIPYVSKMATLRTAKRILSTYPNDRNGEWLEDVSKTQREIKTGRTSLTINNWSRMRSVGFLATLAIIAFLALKFL